MENPFRDSLIMKFYLPSETDGASMVIIGKKGSGQEMEIINSFLGQEAIDLYTKLTTNLNNVN